MRLELRPPRNIPFRESRPYPQSIVGPYHMHLAHYIRLAIPLRLCAKLTLPDDELHRRCIAGRDYNAPGAGREFRECKKQLRQRCDDSGNCTLTLGRTDSKAYHLACTCQRVRRNSPDPRINTTCALLLFPKYFA